MTNQMIQTVTDRANEMRSNPKVQEIMMKFKTTEEGNDWLVKAAIATLVGK